MNQSWTLQFFRDYGGRMSVPSLLRLRHYLIRSAAGQCAADAMLRVRVRQPFAGDVAIREVGSDIDTFDEIVMKEVYRAVASELHDCNYVIDLGANIGLASMYFASKFSSANVLAVEPEASNFRLLQQNTRPLVDAGRCRLLHAAYWHERRDVTLRLPDDATRFDAGTVQHADATASETVPGYPMRDLMAESGFPWIDLLKVDIEGAEAHLFRGDLSWLERTRAMAIEFHGDARAASGFDEVAAEHGFRTVLSDPHTVLAVR